MFQDHDGVGVSDGSLDESLGVLAGIGRNDLEAWNGGVPSRKALTVLGRRTCRVSVGSTKDNGTGNVSGTHVVLFGSRIDNLVDCLHGEVDGHEFHNGTQVLEGCANGKTGESHFSDWGINDSLVSVFLVQSLGNFVGTLVLSDFFSQNKD